MITNLLCMLRVPPGALYKLEERVEIPGFVEDGWLKAAATATGRPAEERRVAVVARRKAEENSLAIFYDGIQIQRVLRGARAL
jgi:hypothetical protein